MSDKIFGGFDSDLWVEDGLIVPIGPVSQGHGVAARRGVARL
jgi:hypothetical protein